MEMHTNNKEFLNIYYKEEKYDKTKTVLEKLQHIGNNLQSVSEQIYTLCNINWGLSSDYSYNTILLSFAITLSETNVKTPCSQEAFLNNVIPFIANLALKAKQILPERIFPKKYNNRGGFVFNALEIGVLIANLYLGCLEAQHDFYFSLDDTT